MNELPLVYEWVDEGFTSGFMNRCKNGWMNVLPLDVWMDEWICTSVSIDGWIMDG